MTLKGIKVKPKLIRFYPDNPVDDAILAWLDSIPYYQAGGENAKIKEVLYEHALALGFKPPETTLPKENEDQVLIKIRSRKRKQTKAIEDAEKAIADLEEDREMSAAITASSGHISFPPGSEEDMDMDFPDSEEEMDLIAALARNLDETTF